MMNALEKQKHRERLEQELLLIQKYFFSTEWILLKEDIENRLEMCEDYIKVDNHIVPELTESYNSLVDFMIGIMQEFYDKISSSLVRDAIALVIKFNQEKFLHFP